MNERAAGADRAVALADPLPAQAADSSPDQGRQVTSAKRLATMKARAALVGVVVHDLQGDDGRPEYIATRWAMTKAFSGPQALDELAAWLDRVGATA